MARRPSNYTTGLTPGSGLTPDDYATEGEKALLAELRAAVAHFANDRGMMDSYAHQQLAALEARLKARAGVGAPDIAPGSGLTPIQGLTETEVTDDGETS